MTSANKKVGYYDFKLSYQYPMSNAIQMDVTSDKETKGQKEAGQVQQENQQAPVWDPKKYIPPHLCTRKRQVERKKTLFQKEIQQDRKESESDPDAM